MHREPVAVGVEVEPAEVDGGAGRHVAPGGEAVGPRVQQREPVGVAGPTPARGPPGKRHELVAPPPEHAAHHADLGQEGGLEVAGAEGDGGLAAPAVHRTLGPATPAAYEASGRPVTGLAPPRRDQNRGALCHTGLTGDAVFF